MRIVIHRGHHSAGIIQRVGQMGIVNGQKGMERIVQFDHSAMYDHGNDDNEDVNKLFGFGFIKGGHHTDSARFGWNYNLINGKVKLHSYCYVNGDRVMTEICEVNLVVKFLLTITNMKNRYAFTVHDAFNTWYTLGESETAHDHNKHWAYRLGCYFGGNNPAPHDITIKISRK